MKSIPSLNAMLICDNIITEAGTNKKSLIGIFENVYGQNFPCIHPFLSVYLKFTGALGEYKFRLELVDLDNYLIIGRGDIPELNIQDKLGTYELVFNLKMLQFKHTGTYEFRIFANDALFGQKKFQVLKIT